MPLTAYDMPSVVMASGTFAMKLYSDVASLQRPINQTVLEVGELEEVVDIEVGVSQVSTLKLKMRDMSFDVLTGTVSTTGTALNGTGTLFNTELAVGATVKANGEERTIATITNDTTATLSSGFTANLVAGAKLLKKLYAEGFWFKVLNGTSQIRLYLTQSGVETFYFYGTPQPETIRWGEQAIGDERVRIVEFDLLSLATSVFDTLIADWITEVRANDVDTGHRVVNDSSFGISVLGLFSAMLKASGLNSTYVESDTSFVYNTQDLKFFFNAVAYHVGQLQIVTRYYNGTTNIYTEYFDTSNVNRLSEKFAYLKDLIKFLLVNIGCVMRFDYDTGTNRHKIQLVQRGRAYSTTLNFNSREKESLIAKSFDLIGDAIRVTHVITGDFTWWSRKFVNGKSTATVPNYVSFDADYQIIFKIGSTLGSQLSRFFCVLDASVLQFITAVDYFNYNSAVYVTATGNIMEEAVGGYQYHRFANDYPFISRRYGQLKADDGTANDHTRLSIMRRTTINDGLNNFTYYANKVRKLASADEVEVEWIKETN